MARALAVAALLLVLLQIGTYDTCEGLTAGDTYRPPLNTITYFEGSVMWKPIRLYLVWYGTWTEAEKALVRTAANSLTPNKRIHQYPNLSNYWNIVRKYYQLPIWLEPNSRKEYVTNKVSIAGEVQDNYSWGKNIRFDGIDAVLISHLGAFPEDFEQGIYVLFTSGDVQISEYPEGPGVTDHYNCGVRSQTCVHPFEVSCVSRLDHMITVFVPHASGQYAHCNLFHEGPIWTEGPTSVGFKGLPPNHLVSPSGALDSMIAKFLYLTLKTAVSPNTDTLGWVFNRTETSQGWGTETADLCSYTFVAGDWYYCNLPEYFPDFSRRLNDEGSCLSFSDHHSAVSALTEPKSKTTFNLYGLGGSKFIAQQFWSLHDRGCVLQLEDSCSRFTLLRHRKGTIRRGLFFKGVGLQHYAPGQDCSWRIQVPKAKRLNLHFETVALGYDDLDFVTVAIRGTNIIKKKLIGFGKNIRVKVTGNDATVRFVTYGRRSPYPNSAGFIMHYVAEY